MENIIYKHLIGNGYKVDVGCVTFYQKDDEGKTTREAHLRLILFVIKEVSGCIYNLLIRYRTKINGSRNNAH